MAERFGRVDVTALAIPATIVITLIASAIAVTLQFGALKERVAQNTAAVTELTQVLRTTVEGRLRELEVRITRLESAHAAQIESLSQIQLELRTLRDDR